MPRPALVVTTALNSTVAAGAARAAGVSSTTADFADRRPTTAAPATRRPRP